MKKKEFRSKTSQINFTRDALLYLFQSYAWCAQKWEPAKEGDYNSLVESINNILEENI